eukprot:comp49197_c0_seq1/m.47623 comp49197_c0_seq1/g.47623  ORF comp49197_c0_seq1/g.47623 comp49197_c0_seq1/m.47623 type:complete len:207 (-) comp49197_c0_seq1:563-1183(-)
MKRLLLSRAPIHLRQWSTQARASRRTELLVRRRGCTRYFHIRKSRAGFRKRRCTPSGNQRQTASRQQHTHARAQEHLTESAEALLEDELRAIHSRRETTPPPSSARVIGPDVVKMFQEGVASSSTGTLPAPPTLLPSPQPPPHYFLRHVRVVTPTCLPVSSVPAAEIDFGTKNVNANPPTICLGSGPSAFRPVTRQFTRKASSNSS